jgi:hypothetical protein
MRDVIHLDLTMSEYDLKVIINDLGLNKTPKSAYLYDVRNSVDGGYIKGILITKESGYSSVWIDGNSGDYIAYRHSSSDNITFSSEVQNYLLNLNATKPNRKSVVGTPIVESNYLDMDSILDKISRSGINSLTKSERYFLDNNN